MRGVYRPATSFPTDISLKMDTNENHENKVVAETTDRKYQLTFQQHAGKKNSELQAQITRPS